MNSSLLKVFVYLKEVESTKRMMMMMGARAQFSPGAAQEARIVNNGGGANLRPVLLADNDLSDFELFEVSHTLTTGNCTN